MTMDNAIRSRNRTLGELLAELKARLGFQTQGASTMLADPLFTSFLQEAHDYVFEELEAPLSTKRTTIKVVPGSKLYDFNNDLEDEPIDPHSVESVHLYDTPTSQYTMRQGITEQMRCDDTTRSSPERYDILNGQIEVWPTPDAEYPMVVIYRQGKSRFTQPSDRPSVPDRLVMLYAVASAKAHYNHRDAQTAGAIFQKYLRLEKQKQHDNMTYSVKPRPESTRTVRRTADGRFVL